MSELYERLVVGSSTAALLSWSIQMTIGFFPRSLFEIDSITAKSRQMPNAIGKWKDAMLAPINRLPFDWEANVSLLQAIIGVKQAFIEQRRSLRENVQFPAWIDIGNGKPPRGCTVLDVSEDGARVMIAPPTELPDELYLVLSKHGTRRRCRLVWRSDEEVGLFYLGQLEFGPPIGENRNGGQPRSGAN